MDWEREGGWEESCEDCSLEAAHSLALLIALHTNKRCVLITGVNRRLRGNVRNTENTENRVKIRNRGTEGTVEQGEHWEQGE